MSEDIYRPVCDRVESNSAFVYVKEKKKREMTQKAASRLRGRPAAAFMCCAVFHSVHYAGAVNV